MKKKILCSLLALCALLIGCGNDIEQRSLENGIVETESTEIGWNQDEEDDLSEDFSESEDELMEAALEAGAEDFITEEDGYEVVTAPEDFAAVRDELQAKGYEFISADVKLIPQTTTELTDETQLKMMNKLVDMLEDDDDVQNVYHNWEIAE